MARKTKKKKRKCFTTPLFVLIIILIIGFLGYSVFTYQNSQQEQEGFFTCSKDGKTCEISRHIHSEIEMSVCGEEIIFPKEKGNLNKQHTHKEKNRLHWHARIKVDPITRKPLDQTPLNLASFLEQMEYKFPEACPSNSSSQLKVYVNGQFAEDKLNYIWKDADKISVLFN
ncbi:MAG: hypothetical protein Q7R51_01800 [bacterium]|nr:hypothetical protein [bacterium]